MWDLRASLALCCYHQRVPRGEFNHRQAEQKGTGHQSIQHGQGCCKSPWKMPHLALSQNPAAGSILCTAPCGHPALRSGARGGSS